MLRSLSIDNFALIDKSTIKFKNGFTVITGETGSGKSILLGALNLILGERADYTLIGPSKEKASVEVELDLKGFALGGFFQLNDLDYADLTIVRREITKNGKTRAFINDTPVSVSTLRDLGSRLIHIHSQYNTLELKDPVYQLEVLDILAGTAAKRDQFTKLYLELNGLKSELHALIDLRTKSENDKDYLSFQLSELNQLELDNLNYAELEDRFKVVESGDELRSILESIHEGLSDDSVLLSQLSELRLKLSKKAGLSTSIDQIATRLEKALIELQDVSSDAEREISKLDIDPEEFQQLSSSLDRYNQALYKFKKTDQVGLVSYRDEIKTQLDSITSASEDIAALTKKIETLSNELYQTGEELHQKRVEAANNIEDLILIELNELKLPDCRLTFEIEKRDLPDKYGYSSVNMMFSPNKGLDPVPIHKAASGGELSRVMLALQYLVSQHIQLQTILFDEIDTGVSGEVAARIGNTLRKMGETMQVIAITHLPQVAGKGLHHLKVKKELSAEDRTVTVVAELTVDERVDEIASLMSGDSITDGARSNAISLLQS